MGYKSNPGTGLDMRQLLKLATLLALLPDPALASDLCVCLDRPELNYIIYKPALAPGTPSTSGFRPVLQLTDLAQVEDLQLLTEPDSALAPSPQSSAARGQLDFKVEMVDRKAAIVRIIIDGELEAGRRYELRDRERKLAEWTYRSAKPEDSRVDRARVRAVDPPSHYFCEDLVAVAIAVGKLPVSDYPRYLVHIRAQARDFVVPFNGENTPLVFGRAADPDLDSCLHNSTWSELKRRKEYDIRVRVYDHNGGHSEWTRLSLRANRVDGVRSGCRLGANEGSLWLLAGIFLNLMGKVVRGLWCSHVVRIASTFAMNNRDPA